MWKPVLRRSFCLFLLSLALFAGCTPRDALRRTLSPLGFAWYGDLERLRGLYQRFQRPTLPQRRVMAKLERDRWTRSVSVTIQAIRLSAKRHRLSGPQMSSWLLRFSKELVQASRRANEPLARWALCEQLRLAYPNAVEWHAFFDELLATDTHPVVRKAALQTLLVSRLSSAYRKRVVSRALRDVDYWVRSGVLFVLMSAVFVHSHPLQPHAGSILRECASLPLRQGQTTRAPRTPFALQQNCLLLMVHLPKRQSQALLPWLQQKAREEGGVQQSAKKALRLLAVKQGLRRRKNELLRK